MTSKRFIPSVLISLLLAACAAPSSSAEPSLAPSEAQMDDQGAVTVTVTPLNLDSAVENLEFEVVMDTHSVELDMDLAVLSTLTTDTGKTVQASMWDAPREGHHVRGTLKFPATLEGAPVLEGVTSLTLTIEGVDVPERIFTWNLIQ